MPINPRVSARIDAHALDRIDRCVEAANAMNPGHPIERGGMVRVLLLNALPAMEAEYGLAASSSAPPKKKTARSYAR